jgi:hydroxymethylpyrimidine/phosphomethylpyrimidine kinase
MPPIFSPQPTPPLVLSFAASDPTGGAGIQADLLTLASMGCHPLSVITAITVQDTAGVEEILVIDAEWVGDQARMLLEDVPVAAFKLGMLGSPSRSRSLPKSSPITPTSRSSSTRCWPPAAATNSPPRT